MSEEAVQSTEASTDDATTQEVSGIEDIARANGWKPESEWKGDPPRDGFKTAEEFVKDGFKIQQTQHDKIDRLQEQLQGISQRMEAMSAGEAKRLRKALEDQAARLKAERNEAIEVGDTTKFNQLDEQLQKTNAELNEVEQSDSTEQAFIKGEEAFKQRNSWFEEDKAMTAFAFNIAGGLRSAFPNMSADEYYSELERAVKEQFPQKFTNQRREAGSAVEGNSPASNPSTRKKGFDSLPAEAKAAFEELSYYNKKMTKADYAKAFYEMEND